MTKAPCYQCEERHEACHGHCDKYKAWSEELKRQNMRDKEKLKAVRTESWNVYWDQEGRSRWQLKQTKKKR